MAKKNNLLKAMVGIAIVIILAIVIQQYVIPHPATPIRIKLGTAYAQQFNLSFIAPQLDYSTGYTENVNCNSFITQLHASSFPISPPIWVGIDTNITEERITAGWGFYQGKINWTANQAGSYRAWAVCFKRSTTYDNSTGIWGTWTQPSQVDIQTEDFEVYT